MANTYSAIATVTVGNGGAGSIQFTSIPGTYKDLLIKYSLRSLRSGANFDTAVMSFNSNSSNMSQITFQGGGRLVATSTFVTSGSNYFDVNAEAGGSQTSDNIFSNTEVYVADYTSSSAKSISVDMVTENNAIGSYSAYADLASILWNSTSAVTSIGITANNGNWAQYSTATLYGIKNS